MGVDFMRVDLVGGHVIHVIKWTRPRSPSVFAYCKRFKTGQWESLGTRLLEMSMQVWHYSNTRLLGLSNEGICSLTEVSVNEDIPSLAIYLLLL